MFMPCSPSGKLQPMIASSMALGSSVGLWKKGKFWSIMDLAGLCVPLALAFGRVGCFLNGCCYGKPTTLPWGVVFPTAAPLVARHPTQLYELVLDLGLFAFLRWKKDSFARDGTASPKDVPSIG